jgi:hypothetical protein
MHRRRLLHRSAAPAAVLAALALAPGALAAKGLPLGPGNLPETREVTQVAPGVTHLRIVRGYPSARDVFTVDVGFTASVGDARALAQRLTAAGFDAQVTKISDRAQDDPLKRKPLGWRVRSGAFATMAEGTARQQAIAAAGIPALRVSYTGEDGVGTTGPWIVNVLEVAPDPFSGLVEPVLGTDIVPGNELVTSIAARTHALAAINGGYFTIAATDGTPGDPAGISVIDGGLVSEAVNGRTSLILPHGDGAGARVATLSTSGVVGSSDGATRLLDGFNRASGLIRACGGTGGDVPTQLPKHDFTCLDTSELIAYTPRYGATAPTGDGVEVAIDGAGVVQELRTTRGGPIPLTGMVLGGTGDAADWLRAHAQPGQLLSVSETVLADGAPLPLGNGLGVVNGGPRLLRDGQVDIPAFTEGFVYPENGEFYYRFAVRRNPRTVVGVKADGTILLVTVEGRQPGYSVGASFLEEAKILRSLGAGDGLNLDGGGSTAMTIGSQLITHGSDATGERPVGDAIVLAPAA